MIITLIILVTLITLAHKSLMKTVESYEYGHHHKEYDYISCRVNLDLGNSLNAAL